MYRPVLAYEIQHLGGTAGIGGGIGGGCYNTPPQQQEEERD